jgi:serine/threonine-protein kinase RsbW
MDDAAPLMLKVQAVPEEVGRVRNEVAAKAETLGLDHEGVTDLKTIISEACSNVVRHAYPEESGDRTMEVEVAPEEEMLRVVIRDYGAGIRPPTGARPSSLRLGFILMGALADCLQLRTGKGRGTELLLKVPLTSKSAGLALT